MTKKISRKQRIIAKRRLRPLRRHVGDWRSVDFHVHSPTSRDFERPDEDRSYFWLLERADKAQLDVIVITDHNSVGGYKKLSELRTQLDYTKMVMERLNKTIDTDIQHQIELFSKIVVLPGVELDIKPNLHMLVIFDPSMTTDDMDDFVASAGYPISRRDDNC